jgi:zinc D-Ala-D-Ala carboxypeptidase
MDGLARVQERISDIEARIAAFSSFSAGSIGVAGTGNASSTGYGPGLAGALVTEDVSFEEQYAAVLESARSAGMDVGVGETSGYSSTPISAASSVGGSAAVSSGRTQPPPEFVAYGNGRIPEDQLVPVGQGGHRLHSAASQSFQQMRADAASQGITLKLTDSYRPYAEQVDLAERKGLYSQGGLAATPGTSIHGWGLAIDVNVNDQATLSWLRANASRYGWVEPVPREAWHWEYRGLQG